MSITTQEIIDNFENRAREAHLEECLYPAKYSSASAASLPPSYMIANMFVQLIQGASPEQREKLVKTMIDRITIKDQVVRQLDVKDDGSPMSAFQEAARTQVGLQKDTLKILQQTLAIWAPEALARSKPAETPKATPV